MEEKKSKITKLDLFKGATKIAVAMINNRSFFKSIVKSINNPDDVTNVIVGHSIDVANKLKRKIDD